MFVEEWICCFILACLHLSEPLLRESCPSAAKCDSSPWWGSGIRWRHALVLTDCKPSSLKNTSAGYNRSPMKLIINGEEKDLDIVNVESLLQALDLVGRPVAVEVNRQLVPKRDHTGTLLQDGDEVELVTLVGGG